MYGFCVILVALVIDVCGKPINDKSQILISSYSQVSRSGSGSQNEGRSNTGQTLWTKSSDAHVIRGQNLSVKKISQGSNKQDKLTITDTIGKGEVIQERFNPRPWLAYETISGKGPVYTPPNKSNDKKPDFALSVPFDSFPLSLKPGESEKPSTILKPPFENSDQSNSPPNNFPAHPQDAFDPNDSENLEPAMNSYGSPYNSYHPNKNPVKKPNNFVTAPPEFLPPEMGQSSDLDLPPGMEKPQKYLPPSVMTKPQELMPPGIQPPDKYLPPQIDTSQFAFSQVLKAPPEMSKKPQKHTGPQIDTSHFEFSHVNNHPHSPPEMDGKPYLPGQVGTSHFEFSHVDMAHHPHLPPEMDTPPKHQEDSNHPDESDDMGPPITQTTDHPGPYYEHGPDNHNGHGTYDHMPNHATFHHPPNHASNDHPSDHSADSNDYDNSPPNQPPSNFHEDHHFGRLPSYLEHDPKAHGHHFDHYFLHDHHPPVYHEVKTTEAPEHQRLNQRPYSYYYLGRKLWYIPLYFSIYFIIYIFVLILKSIARHKITFSQYFEEDKREMKDMHHVHEEHVEELSDHVIHGMNAARRKYIM